MQNKLPKCASYDQVKVCQGTCTLMKGRYLIKIPCAYDLVKKDMHTVMLIYSSI